ncbi:MAG: DUF177 domain-containing protein [Deferribacterales bacterium]|uniref:YceD family protein n=1 Tax=Deferrivibrio essentukiensis TaxID=2880922 RepID=UPI0019B4DEE1|nr:DUF177 domain-containing protein [Deferrivibrio essentukiensis]MBC7195743.1 DUF177 domain-containing protein [Deferribacterales bacterium]MCB4204864.1 DUF177 domain-containing protein [Deferrivibrio essentukiensis]
MRIYFEQIPEEGKKFSFEKRFSVDDTDYVVESFEGVIYPAGDGYLLDSTLKIKISDICDRCLERFEESFDERITLEIVKSKNNDEEKEVELSDEDVGFYIVEENIIDLEHIVMQESVLLRPVKRVCGEDCKGICSGCGANLNIESCECKEDIDDRWKALADLMQKKQK